MIDLLRQTVVFLEGLVIALLRLLFRLWKVLLTPFLGQNCRFYPSCSHYASEALEHHGLLRGGYLSVLRLARCNSLFDGGVDLVPPQPKISGEK